MNFEKGKGPLKALNLGSKQMLEKQLQDVADWIGCFHDDIPKVIDFLLSKKADVELLVYYEGDLAEMYWTNCKGERRRSRIGYPDKDQITNIVFKRKWYGKKYRTIEKQALGPFNEMVADIKFSEENLDWEQIEII